MKTSKKLSATDSYNARILTGHAALRAQILALRPTWDAAKLEAVTAGYGAGCAGLYDILDAIKLADALAAKFA